MDKYTLSNGVKIPKVAYGTWQTPNGNSCYEAVKNALSVGYTHVDTAMAYGNEESVGKAVNEYGRHKVFLTSKLPAEIKSYEEAKTAIDDSLKNLNTGYIDLYLIHAPWPWDQIGKDCRKENISLWKAFEEAYREGKLRAIGVSNFNVDDLESLINHCEIPPMANQIQLHVGGYDKETYEYCRRKGILVEAYCPNANGRILNREDLKKIADKYGVSVPQLCIKFCLEKEALPIPKSMKVEHMKENLDLDFDLRDIDLDKLEKIKE